MLLASMFKLELLISLSLLFVLTRCTQGQQEEEESYDDSTRMGCMQAINAMAQEHPAINDAAEPFVLKGMQFTILDKNPNRIRTQVTKTSYPDPTTEAYQTYQQACEDGGGIFVPFTGALDCMKTVMDRTFPGTSIYDNMATCFTSGPECERYTSGPMAAATWMIDTQQVFQNVCTLLEGSLNNIEIAIPLSDAPMPPGTFSVAPATEANLHYKDLPRKQCMNAMAEALGILDDDEEEDSPVTTAHFDHMRSMVIETIQEAPILTQKKWYEESVTDQYRRSCQEAQRRFDSFAGTLDCIDSNSGRKITTVYENAAICFPTSPLCEGYTSWAQWIMDTNLGVGKMYCAIRASTTVDRSPTATPTASPDESSSSPKESSSKPAVTQNYDFPATRSTDSSLVLLLLVMVVACVILLAVIVCWQLGGCSWKKQENGEQNATEDCDADHASTTEEASLTVGLPGIA